MAFVTDAEMMVFYRYFKRNEYFLAKKTTTFSSRDSGSIL